MGWPLQNEPCHSPTVLRAAASVPSADCPQGLRKRIKRVPSTSISANTEYAWPPRKPLHLSLPGAPTVSIASCLRQ